MYYEDVLTAAYAGASTRAYVTYKYTYAHIHRTVPADGRRSDRTIPSWPISFGSVGVRARARAARRRTRRRRRRRKWPRRLLGTSCTRNNSGLTNGPSVPSETPRDWRGRYRRKPPRPLRQSLSPSYTTSTACPGPYNPCKHTILYYTYAYFTTFSLLRAPRLNTYNYYYYSA